MSFSLAVGEHAGVGQAIVVVHTLTRASHLRSRPCVHMLAKWVCDRAVTSGDVHSTCGIGIALERTTGRMTDVRTKTTWRMFRRITSESWHLCHSFFFISFGTRTADTYKPPSIGWLASQGGIRHGSNRVGEGQGKNHALQTKILDGRTNISMSFFEALFKGVSTGFGPRNVEKCFEKNQRAFRSAL